MDMRIRLMGLMEVDLMVDTSQIEMTRLEMIGSWILQSGEVMDRGTILVLLLTGTMIVIVIILTGGEIGDIFRMSSRKQSHLPLMGK